jgi:hypothetical protein
VTHRRQAMLDELQRRNYATTTTMPFVAEELLVH